MPKIEVNPHKESKKGEIPQEKSGTPEEKKDQRGVLPEDIDFHRGMGCG